MLLSESLAVDWLNDKLTPDCTEVSMGYGRGGGGGENVENGVKKNGDIYSRAHADFVVLAEDGAPAKPPNSKKSEPPIDTSPPASLPVSRRPSSSGSLSRSQAFDQKVNLLN